uniref:Gamma-interferon-inducible lysosomal thiol reductase n=1 Tax=Gouania willdenowi TaxID=441366 RepID=A0A8C5I7Y5_GOUWI
MSCLSFYGGAASALLFLSLSSVIMKLSGLLAVLFLLCDNLTGLGSSHPKPACRYPPSQWCRSLEIAVECKVQKQCMEVRALQPNLRVPPVSITLYYESLSPACRAFITQQLFPTWTMLQHIMAVTLIPYGNAEVLTTDWFLQDVSSPASPECRGNVIEACIIHLTGHSLAFPIIHCMESSIDVLSAAESCIQMFSPSLSWSTVDSCVRGSLGKQLMHDNAVMTRALNPAHRHIPWVTFNGEYTKENEDQAWSSLVQLVCQLYRVRTYFVCAMQDLKNAQVYQYC